MVKYETRGHIPVGAVTLQRAGVPVHTGKNTMVRAHHGATNNGAHNSERTWGISPVGGMVEATA